MNHYFTLATDFIDRMANPAFGIQTNEQYALKFAQLLSSEGFTQDLSNQMSRLEKRDIDQLSSHGWLWVLNWSKGNEVKLDDELLHSLMQKFRSVFVQAMIIETATLSESDQDLGRTRRESDGGWLYEEIRRSVEINLESSDTFQDEDFRERANRITEGAVLRSERLLIGLLQVGSQRTLSAATQLLKYPWQGQSKLHLIFYTVWSEQDEQTRSAWLAALGIRSIERDRFERDQARIVFE
jgi:hypothetical protein